VDKIEINPKKKIMNYIINILVDTPDSWILPWAQLLKKTIAPFNDVYLCNTEEEMREGDFAFFLGCTKILSLEFLKRNKLNLVIHESDLPSGRGWSPMVWQILEGKNNIPIVLFEAREELDSGKVYLRDVIQLDGTELLPEIREKQGKKTVELVLRFLERWPDIGPTDQIGCPTYYPRRTIDHDKIDVNKTIAENFDNLRIVDNHRYPAWFEYRGREYKLTISYKD
jgi:methionyl-tRNA formyltransferase